MAFSIDKLSSEFGKYIELEQKYIEIELSIAKTVITFMFILVIVPLIILGYFYSGLKGMGIFFTISLFIILIGYGIYNHKTSILNIEKKEERRNKILAWLYFIIGNKAKEEKKIQIELKKDKDRIIKEIRKEGYVLVFEELYNYIENKNLNEKHEILNKIEKILTLHSRKFYSVLFYELKMNICTWNRLIINENIKKVKGK